MTDKGCVFVTGIWKSGNHLAYSALNALGINGPFNGIAAHLVNGRHRWAKRLIRGPKGNGDSIQVGLETEAFVSQRWMKHQARRLSGKIMGGHAAYSPKMAETLRSQDARMICIRRDPRDILVSFADWIGGRDDFYLHPDFKPLSREDRVRVLLNGGPTQIAPIFPFLEILERGRGWLTEEGVLQVRFEDLLGPSGGQSMEAQRQAVEAIHGHIGASIPLAQVDIASIYGGSLTFNKGRSERWRELEDKALVADIETQLAPILRDWGYEQ